MGNLLGEHIDSIPRKSFHHRHLQKISEMILLSISERTCPHLVHPTISMLTLDTEGSYQFEWFVGVSMSRPITQLNEQFTF